MFSRLMTVDEARADHGLPSLPDGAGDRLMTADEIAQLRLIDRGDLPGYRFGRVVRPKAEDVERYRGDGGAGVPATV